MMDDDDGGNHTLVHATPLQFSRGAWFKHIKHSSGPPLDPLWIKEKAGLLELIFERDGFFFMLMTIAYAIVWVAPSYTAFSCPHFIVTKRGSRARHSRR